VFVVGDRSSPDKVCLKWLASYCTECVLFRRAQASRLTELETYIAAIIVAMGLPTVLLNEAGFFFIDS
jgi:hypothetical protein